MIICYHHGDLDGICAAAIVNKVYRDVKCIPVQYGKDTWNLQDVVDAEEVFVVDFTFPDMEKLAEIAGNKLHWLDHHQTAMESHLELWNKFDVRGYRELGCSGCGLTWDYCYNEEAPDTVKFIEDHDLWLFKLENTKAFCMGISQLVDDPHDSLWDSLLEGEYTEELKCIELGEILFKARDRRIKYLFENGIDIKFMGYSARAVNATSDTSILGECIYQKPEYELAIIWHIKGEKTIISLRSNSVDCSKIAQKYGGGGHPGAAGFSIEASCNLLTKLLGVD